jgi:hypothetical protein
MQLALSRFAQLLGMFAIGDGAASVVAPRAHVALWCAGPRPWRKAMLRLARRPGLTRTIGVAEVALGALIVGAALRAARKF